MNTLASHFASVGTPRTLLLSGGSEIQAQALMTVAVLLLSADGAFLCARQGGVDGPVVLQGLLLLVLAREQLASNYFATAARQIRRGGDVESPP